MPRRPAPSPLRLYRGPTPPRNAPRHTIPSVPRPTFHPIPTISSSSSPTDTASPSSSSSDLPLHPLPPSLPMPAALSAIGHANGTTAGMPGVPQHTTLHVLPTYVPRPVSNPGDRVVMLGPWDRSRRMSWTEDEISKMVAPPEPAVPNPAPISW